ncbi:hypothetical protein B5808_19175 (plasmid) [Cnuibacter physcomitrellae]|uniref:Uncharacterized protein n=1 Tax=Cnuibacter physcomitrellae TaxID=1619308 RepID=A0A1X9LQR5_9MICO|nr:hypothetical protein B5808_19175 [Cnuibacter physcomitrellae]
MVAGMVEEILVQSQLEVQRAMTALVAGNIDARADEARWENELAELVYASEEAWERCNAFLFGYTLARHIAVLGPVTAVTGDASEAAFTSEFVACAGSGRGGDAIARWLSFPVANPRATAKTRQVAAVTVLLHELRAKAAAASVPVDWSARPGPFADGVWFEFTSDTPGVVPAEFDAAAFV